MARFEPQDPRSLLLRTHCQTSGWSLTATDVRNNVVRTCVEALAAVHGGTQSLHTNSFDEALALPSDRSARIARNTQLLLQRESGACRSIDPWGGSFYVERLTRDLVARAEEHLREGEELGGMTRAIEAGLPKLRIEESAARTQARIDAGRQAIVGVNRWRPEEEEPVEVLRVDNAKVLRAQLDRLATLKRERDEAATEAALAALTAAAAGREGNLLALTVDCARAKATVGEMAFALERVFGRHSAAIDSIAGVYGGEMGESGEIATVRRRAAEFERRTGRRPRILVAKLGQDGHDRGQKIVASALADLGFDVDIGALFRTPEETAREAVENDVHVVGVSSLAAGHLALVPALRAALEAQGRDDILVIVGGVVPPQDHAALDAAGCAAVFGPGTPIPEAAGRLLDLLESARR